MTTPNTSLEPSPALSRGRGKKVQQLRVSVATPGPDKIHYSQEDLATLGISLSFSPLSNLATDMKFFQSLDESVLNGCVLDMDWLGEHDAPLLRLEGLHDNGSWPSYNGVLQGIYGHCRDAVAALQLYYECLRLPKKGKGVGRRLEEVYRWTPIRYGNPFFHAGEQIARPPRSTPAGWERTSLEEWIKPGRDKTPEPHVRVMIINSGVPYEGTLLVSELSAIAQVLEKRVHQPQLQETLCFPILLISLCGPRNGRIIQAHYDAEQDTLELVTSPIISLMCNTVSNLNLLLGFIASKPQLRARGNEGSQEVGSG